MWLFKVLERRKQGPATPPRSVFSWAITGRDWKSGSLVPHFFLRDHGQLLYAPCMLLPNTPTPTPPPVCCRPENRLGMSLLRAAWEWFSEPGIGGSRGLKQACNKPKVFCVPPAGGQQVTPASGGRTLSAHLMGHLGHQSAGPTQLWRNNASPRCSPREVRQPPTCLGPKTSHSAKQWGDSREGG